MRPSAVPPELRGARRIWIVNHYAEAPDGPSGTRHVDLARRLVAAGDAVTIFAAGLSHVTGRDDRIPRHRLTRKQTFDGVDFVWLRTSPYAGNGFRRPLNMLSFVIVFLVVQARMKRPHVVVGSTVHPFAALGAWLVARARGARFVFEVRDLWPQTLIDLGALAAGSAGARALGAMESFLVRHADAVVTLLPGMHEYLVERGLPTRHVVYVPNGVDLARFDELRLRPTAHGSSSLLRGALDAIASLRATGRTVFGYVGAFGRVNHLDVIVEAAALAEEIEPGRVGLVLVGDGPERSRIERSARHLPNIVLSRAVPKADVPPILDALDATVVHTTRNPVYRYGVSFNKLFEGMAAGRPVIFATVSAYDPVATTGAGLSVPPDDPGALAEALVALAATTADHRRAMGVAGRAYVAREHDLALLAGRFRAALSEDGNPG